MTTISEFANAGKLPGLEIWRIEQKVVVKQAKVDGSFNSDNAYLVLVTEQKSKNQFAYSIYTWSGTDCSVNESKVALQNAMELAKLIGGDSLPVAEEQGSETQKFLDAFVSLGGIKYKTNNLFPKRNSNISAPTRSRTLDKEYAVFEPQQQQQISILKRIIRDSIVAFPGEAHLKVLEFFVSSGLDDDKAHLLRQCWSKVLLGSQAFGRKANSSNTIANPELFADELIRELSYADKELTRLVSLPSQYVSNGDPASDADTETILKNIRLFSRIEKQLATAVRDVFTPHDNSTNDSANSDTNHELHVQTSIAAFRSGLKGTRINFKTSKTSSLSSVTYSALDKHLHGGFEQVSGILTLPRSTTHDDHHHRTHTLKGDSQLLSRELPPFLSTTDLIGLRVTSSQSRYQERVWSSYQCLNELLSCQTLNPFPLPIGIHRDGSHVIFAFESLSARTLSPLFGPALSTYLRKHPSVILLWCGQLISAYRALKHYCTGSLVRHLSLNDVWIRENGMLLFGNIAFQSTVNTVSSEDVGVNNDVDAFLRMSCELLSKSLCLSRSENIPLKTASIVDSMRETNHSVLNEHTVDVVAGSSIELVLSGYKCHSVCTVLDIDSVQLTPNTLYVRVDTQVRDFSVSSDADPVAPSLANGTSSKLNSNKLYIHTVGPGLVTLHLSVQCTADSSDSDTVSSSHRGSSSIHNRLLECIVRVVVIPRYTIASVSAIELIGYLEEYQRHRMISSDIGIPEVILNAQCCSENSLKRLSILLSRENSDRQLANGERTTSSNIQHDWTEICRAIERLGVKNSDI